MNRIPADIVDEVIATANLSIVDLIGQSVELRRKDGELRGSCPFPDDNGGSFTVNQKKELWKCFTCDRGGDALGFVRQYFGMSFPEAIRFLGDRYGVSVPAFQPKRSAAQSPQEQAREEARQRRQSMLATVVELASAVDEEPVARLGGGRISGILPPLKEVVSKLRALGYDSDDLRSIGITSNLTADKIWLDGGPVVWAALRSSIYAIRPVTRSGVPVIGARGTESGGWVGMDGAQMSAARSGVVLIAAESDTLCDLRSMEEHAVMPIGRVGQATFERVVPVSADPLVLTRSDHDARRRALRLALSVANISPRVGVAELGSPTEAVDHARALREAIETAGNVFEWQAGILHAEGRLRTEEGRREAAIHLVGILDRIPSAGAEMEWEVSASMLNRVTGLTVAAARAAAREAVVSEGAPVRSGPAA
jgi:hypothetical protein